MVIIIPQFIKRYDFNFVVNNMSHNPKINRISFEQYYEGAYLNHIGIKCKYCDIPKINSIVGIFLDQLKISSYLILRYNAKNEGRCCKT